MAGIATDVTTEFTAQQLQEKELVLNLSNRELLGENILRLQIITTGSALRKGISLLELFAENKTRRTLIYRSELHAFRSVEEEQTHCLYFLEKGIKRHLAGYTYPSDKELPTKSATPLPEALLKKTTRLFQRDNWFCNVIHSPIEVVALNKGKKAAKAILPPDKHSLMADPFGIIHKGREFVLFERQESGKKGEIACFLEGEVTTVFKSEYHLSYPFLLEKDGKIYCIPEQHESGRLDLYEFNPESRSISFKKTILKDFAATDPTVVLHKNKYWLFCTDTADQGANSRLHLFYADHPEGEWKPHRQNPIKISVKGSRPGGTLFTHEGHLYRPGQNSAETYGGSLIIYRIDQLTESEFSETAVNEIFPGDFGSGFAGIHTISKFGNKTLIDLKQKVFSFRNILQYLRKT